jgi:L-threonylcarbamoyladenylate synthase
LKTELLAATPDAIERAVDLLERGEVVALPTETVYGLAADATNPTAAAKIFEAKERPFFDPLIVHLPDKSWLDRVTQIPNGDALLVTGGLQTVAVRMSSHAVLRAVLEKFGKPVAAPSANRFGRISPTAAEHVRAELDGKIPLILDGGATQHGIESTIVAVGKNVMRILRAGPITHEELAPFCEVIETGHGEKPQAPGQLESHYAPRTPMRLIKNSAAFKPASAERCGLIAFNQRRHAPAFSKVEILSATGDLREAAANFFAAMRRLDEAGLDLIVAEEIPETGLGRAIMDRLRKAAAQKGNC